jgi:Indole-3-glycerol phosphate synthase
MRNREDVAPAVESILSAARGRGLRGDGERVAVDPRSLATAFEAAAADRRVPIIAEIKPTSPTTTGVRDDDPVDLAHKMVDGGAAALSVLTEPDHFGGDVETLTAIRRAVDVPVLRKDFLLRKEQLDTVAADVVLLIARFVDDLDGLVTAARARGFQVLVEVHDRAELEAAVAADTTFIGVNNRDLAALEVDLDTFGEVAPAAPDDVTLIGESGVSTQGDVSQLREAGADALLIGTAIMDGDIETNTRQFVTTEHTS